MMRHNKVLSLAIASALSLGVSTAYAGELTIKHYSSAANSPGIQLGAPTFASELFLSGNDEIPDGSSVPSTVGSGIGSGADADPTTTADNGPDNLDGPTDPVDGNSVNGDAAIGDNSTGNYDDNYIYAIYKFKSTVNEKFLAKFELSNGAAFGDDVDLGAGTALDFVAHPSGSHVAVTSSGAFGPAGKKGESIATFLIQPSDDTNTFVSGDHLFFRFTLKNLSALQSPGEEVKMTVTIYDQTGTNETDGPAPSVTVASSARGADISLDASAGIVQVDVSQESTKFVGNIIDETTAVLGTLKVDEQNGRLQADGSQWEFAADTPQPNSAIFTIQDGNFAASKTSPGQVFLDINGDGAYNSTDNDILATTVEDDFAQWTLTNEQLIDIKDVASSSTALIIIKADGTNEINTFKDAPQATFVVDYGGGNTDPYSGKLRHIKRNGTVCTLYNIPNPNALDTASIRVTNTSAVEGRVMGTLRALDGTEIFTNQELVATLAPFATVRLGPGDLDPITRNQAWLDAGGADAGAGWPGRAILTVSSNIQSMEIFGLARNKSGGPLINLSVGGSGNGCE